MVNFPNGINSVWSAIDRKFDTSWLTQTGAEERKESNDNRADLVAIVTKINRENNNNQVIMHIDKEWHLLKTCVYQTHDFDYLGKQG